MTENSGRSKTMLYIIHCQFTIKRFLYAGHWPKDFMSAPCFIVTPTLQARYDGHCSDEEMDELKGHAPCLAA